MRPVPAVWMGQGARRALRHPHDRAVWPICFYNECMSVPGLRCRKTWRSHILKGGKEKKAVAERIVGRQVVEDRAGILRGQ